MTDNERFCIMLFNESVKNLQAELSKGRIDKRTFDLKMRKLRTNRDNIILQIKHYL